MTPEDVKQALLRLHDCAEEFTVRFSGKKSGRVNGLYYPASREILIHNLNFIGEDGAVNEADLFYTAMHELAHHIMDTEKHQRIQKAARIHTREFYAVLDDLADKAEELGIYTPELDEETRGLIEDARRVSAEIARLQRELGGILMKLDAVCKKKGLRFEDIAKRKAGIAGATVRKCTRIHGMNLPNGISADAQEALALEWKSGEETQAAMITAALAGKSPAQIQRLRQQPAKPKESKNEETALLEEKARLERTIANLRQRLAEIVRKLNKGGLHARNNGNAESPAA
jgi:hypothetical protein